MNNLMKILLITAIKKLHRTHISFSKTVIMTYLKVNNIAVSDFRALVVLTMNAQR